MSKQIVYLKFDVAMALLVSIQMKKIRDLNRQARFTFSYIGATKSKLSLGYSGPFQNAEYTIASGSRKTEP